MAVEVQLDVCGTVNGDAILPGGEYAIYDELIMAGL
jgi:hypothetical protein